MPAVRLWVRVAALLAALGVALILHGVWRAVRAPSPWPRLLLGAVARIVGIRRRIVGQPLARDVIFLANHVSWTDIPLLAGATGSAFVAKAELRDAPLVGWLCTLNHTLFVRRGERGGLAGQIAAFRTALAGGWPVTIFPEGTTGDGTALLPFKAGLLAALDPPPASVRVQPVRIDYGASTPAVAWADDVSGADHARRLLRRSGTITATLTFCAPFDPAACVGRKAIAAEARARIAAA